MCNRGGYPDESEVNSVQPRHLLHAKEPTVAAILRFHRPFCKSGELRDDASGIHPTDQSMLAGILARRLDAKQAHSVKNAPDSRAGALA